MKLGKLVPGLVVLVLGTAAPAHAGTILVRQDTQPNGPGVFSFTAGGGLSPTTFQLDDDGFASDSFTNTRTFPNVPAGSGYSVSQDTPPPVGYDPPQVSCSDGSSPSNIDLGATERVTCTFVNRLSAAGTIRIVKNSQPDDPQSFSFNLTGPTPPGFVTFSLSDDGSGPENDAHFIVNPGSGYVANEFTPPQWVLQSATCSDGSSVSSITVEPNENVTCTFVNVRMAQIRIIKDAEPIDPQDFSFTAGGGLSPSVFSLDDDFDGTLSNQRVFTGVAPGSGYSVAEMVPADWQQSSATCDDGSPVTNIDVSQGEWVTCTFTNTATDAGTITVRKEAHPVSAESFGFGVTRPGQVCCEFFEVVDDGPGGQPGERSITARPGTTFVTEGDKNGWELLFATCSDGSVPPSIALSAGEDVVCTFVNQKQGGEFQGYPRPKAATPFYAPLVPAHQPCASPNRVHGGSLDYQSCNPPVQTTTTTSVGSPDANGAVANFAGSLRMTVSGSGATADVALAVSVTDVRCMPSGPSTFPCGVQNAAAGRDYVGELGVRGTIRATDRLNGSGAGGPAGTVSDIEWGPIVPCSASASTTIGSTCSLTTTFDTLIPNTVVAGARSIWEQGQISVYDGGPDGDGDTTGDNQLFLRQGVFVP